MSNEIVLISYSGHYVCAEGGGGREVVANRSRLGPWEIFRLIDLGEGKVNLQAHDGQYVCAEGGGGREVVANRSAVGPWEQFYQIPVEQMRRAINAINLVVNNSGGDIWVKPEGDGPNILVRHGESYNDRHDGIAIPRRGIVVKTPDFVSIEVDQHGNFNCTAPVLDGPVLPRIRHFSEVERCWTLDSPPDDGWKPLWQDSGIPIQSAGGGSAGGGSTGGGSADDPDFPDDPGPPDFTGDNPPAGGGAIA